LFTTLQAYGKNTSKRLKGNLKDINQMS